MLKQASATEFPTTLWAVLEQTAEAGERGRAALEATIQRYYLALCVYLAQRHRLEPDEVEDVAQSFIADKFLEQEILRRADARAGRFRSLLMVSIDHYMVSLTRAQNAAKRGKGHTFSGSTSALQMESREPDPRNALDVIWARETINEVLRRMKAECAFNARLDVWGVFESRVLAELLGRPVTELCELQRRYALRSPTQAVNLVVTGKRMFERMLRQVIGEYEPDTDQIDAEIMELRKVLREMPCFAQMA